MAKTVKTISALGRPFYHEAIGHLPAVPRVTERDVPDVSIFQPCGKVSEQWLPHIDGVLSVLLDEVIWRGNETQKFRATQEIFKLMNWLYSCSDEGDNMTRFRQSPTDPCKLEQMIDGNWELAFDYGLCLKMAMPTFSPNEVGEAIEAVIEPLQDIYQDIADNGAQTVFPNTDNDISDPLNAVKNGLLCAVLWDYLTRLRSYVEALVATSQPAPTQEDFFASAGRVVASGFSLIIAIFAPPPIKFLAWLGRAGAGASLAVSSVQEADTIGGYINSIRQNNFENPSGTWSPKNDEIKDMACAMYDVMKDKPITEANFLAGMDAIYAPTGVFSAVADMYKIIMQNNGVFAEFIAIYSGAIIAQDSGATFDNYDNCDCDEEPLVCGFNYQFLGVEVVPENITMYQSIPLNTLPIATSIVPLQWQRPAPAPVENQFRDLYIVSELPCDKPITMMWARGNANSAVAYIQTFDGTTWQVRASGSIGVGGAGGVPQTMTWGNATGIVYMGARLFVRTTIPYIIQFKIG